MPTTVSVPLMGNPVPPVLVLQAEAGKSLVLIGANGAGKTRLGVFLESAIGAASTEVHRIAAHRSLVLNPQVQPISYERAERRLFYGYEEGVHAHRRGHRWQDKPATALLHDFDNVLVALYADENRLSVEHRQRHRIDPAAKPPVTKFDRLKELWHGLLPHRQLVVRDGDVKVKPAAANTAEYSAAELSDGERVLFYLIGQCLLVRTGCVIIVDEPELHIHKAILSRLWDALEAARKDCAFVYLTHDLEFAMTRHGATKYAVKNYAAAPECWDIEPLPESAGLPEDVVSKILGSRIPVLFVEGDGGSLDSALYRRLYPDRTVIPMGSCEHVIHAVSSFRANESLHRIGCAGVIDADDRNLDEVAHLEAAGIYVLPVAEVENLLALPDVVSALAQLLGHAGTEIQQRVETVRQAIIHRVQSDLESFCVRYTKRRIDREMKSIGLNARDIGSLTGEFQQRTDSIEPTQIFNEIIGRAQALLRAVDVVGLLAIYDNKGVLADVSVALGFGNVRQLEEYVGRMLGHEHGEMLRAAILGHLPRVH